MGLPRHRNEIVVISGVALSFCFGACRQLSAGIIYESATLSPIVCSELSWRTTDRTPAFLRFLRCLLFENFIPHDYISKENLLWNAN